jgi:hypothetical protein
LIFSLRPGEAVSHANPGEAFGSRFDVIEEGQRFQAWSRNEDQKPWKSRNAPVPIAICVLHYLFLGPLYW